MRSWNLFSVYHIFHGADEPGLVTQTGGHIIEEGGDCRFAVGSRYSDNFHSGGRVAVKMHPRQKCNSSSFKFQIFKKIFHITASLGIFYSLTFPASDL